MSLTGYNAYTYDRGFRNQEFHHVVLSVSGTVHTLYLDGVQVQQNAAAGNVFATYQTITNTVIGAQATLAQAFQGTIGDVRVYNYAIPPRLVTSLYRDRELIVYYPFDTSVNSLTPNYATLVYDASLIGQPSITASSGANVGSGALSLDNTAGSVATKYVLGTPGIPGQIGWTPDATHGITIAAWINVGGSSGRIQRIFDIPISVGTKGLSVDISGTNMIYSSWNLPIVGRLDLLSASTKNAFTNPTQYTNGGAGAYGTRILYSVYTGPAMRIRRNTDTSQANLTDFYADTNGNLGTGYLATGTSLAAWLTAAGETTAFVTIWYDQTGNGNNAIQTDTTKQPTYNIAGKYINFTARLPVGTDADFLTFSRSPYPSVNCNYTYVVKFSTTNNYGGVLFGGDVPTNQAGTPGTSNSHGIGRAATQYASSWGGSTYTAGGTYVDDAVVTTGYNGSSVYLSANNVNQITVSRTNRNQSTTYNYIGTRSQTYQSLGHGIDGAAGGTGKVYYLYVLPIYLDIANADKLILEATPV